MGASDGPTCGIRSVLRHYSGRGRIANPMSSIGKRLFPGISGIKRPHVHDGRFPYMDSLRAIAALSIVVFHFAGYKRLPDEMAWLQPFFVRLGAGVLVFFVISGFLIYRPFVRANLSASPRPHPGRYAKRRFLRIVPAYFLALTITATLVGKTEVFGPDGFLYYGFLQIYEPGLSMKGLSVAWSLCIEVTLYAFLPIWAWLVAQVPVRTERERHLRERVMLGGLLAVGIGMRFILENNLGRSSSISILSYIDIFALGMVLAYVSVLYEDRKLPRWLAWIDDMPGISWLLAFLSFAAMAYLTGPNQSSYQHAEPIQLWFRHGLSGLLGVFLVLPLAFGDQTKGSLRRILAKPALLWAGVVSYGLYLFHPVVLRTLSDVGLMPPPMLGSKREPSNFFAWWGILAIVFTVTGLVAAASWHFLERPLLTLKDSRLVASDRPMIPITARVVLGVGGVALALAGLDGTGYDFIDFVLVSSGAVIAVAAALPERSPRPGLGLLAAVGVIAVAFALIPGILSLTRPEQASANSSPFAQSAFLTGVVDRGKISLYLNGKLVASGTAPERLSPSAAPFEIGGVKGSKGWNGAVDDVAVWKRPLGLKEIREHYFAGSRSGGKGLAPLIKESPGVVRWYRLGDIASGAKDSIGGSASKRFGSVAQTVGRVAVGDPDGGSLKLIGTGRLVTPPLLKVQRGSMTVEAWVKNGSSVSNRAIMGAQDAWLMKTDVAGHWSFGVKDGKKGYTILSPQSAQRFIPGAAQQVGAVNSTKGVSFVGLLGALAVAIAALMCIPSIRRRFQGLFNPQTRR